MPSWNPARPVAGTTPTHPPDAVRERGAEPETAVEVTFVLAPGDRPDDHPAVLRCDEVDAAAPHERRPLTLDELGSLHAPAPSHVEAVCAYLRGHGLEVLEASEVRHDVVARGTVQTVDRALGIEQAMYGHLGRTWRSHEGPIHLPPEIGAVTVAVLGSSEGPLHRPHRGGGGGRVAAGGGVSLDDLARHYDFPEPAGALPRVAVLESGGYHASDLDTYFTGLGVTPPRIREVNVRDGSGRPTPNDPLALDVLGAISAAWTADGSFQGVLTAAHAALAAKGALPSDAQEAQQAVLAAIGHFESTAEVTMDLQILGGLLPGAPLDVYFCPLSPDGWRRAVFAMIGAPYPGDDAQPMPSVLSISWGGSESGWGSKNIQAIHTALEAAARRGVTICCSSGDWGSRNSRSAPAARPGQPAPPSHQVNFPASSPAVLACGGTRIAPAGEVVWNEEFLGSRMASGGGMSGAFPRPAYQHDVEAPEAVDTWLAQGDGAFEGRWLPDVAANAAFASGVRTVLAGRPALGGGTSAATPIWAALLARIAGAVGKPLGCVNPALYAAGRGLTSVTEGTNDVTDGGRNVYSAASGWDPCTGLGVPRGSVLLAALRGGE